MFIVRFGSSKMTCLSYSIWLFSCQSCHWGISDSASRAVRIHQSLRDALLSKIDAYLIHRACNKRWGSEKGGPSRKLLGQVKSRKLKYFGHVMRHNSLEKDIMVGTLPGKRRQGGQKKQWLDAITQWSGQSLVDMVRLADDRVRYQRFMHEVTHAR